MRKQRQTPNAKCPTPNAQLEAHISIALSFPGISQLFTFSPRGAKFATAYSESSDGTDPFLTNPHRAFSFLLELGVGRSLLPKAS